MKSWSLGLFDITGFVVAVLFLTWLYGVLGNSAILIFFLLCIIERMARKNANQTKELTQKCADIENKYNNLISELNNRK